ncbi:scarecrow-like protein 28 [Actinidia eriantha]|uniref:scarecrow-like protein 28 n=1 Tax=Actinidia eriantha TaxID=165200 RepID=UPI002587B6F6|nr:scarecrow-like protein 28 [Actinidia eriantha]
MLAGCSPSTLLSPRHRMSTQRLDLPCSFARKDASRSQPIRPVGISVDKPSFESKTNTCSLKQTSIKGEFWEKGKSLKRFAEQGCFGDDDSFMSRAKRKRSNGKPDDSVKIGQDLSLGQLGSGKFWFQPNFTNLNIPQVPFSLSCSGDEERACFVPSELISPPLPPRNTQITELGDKEVETSHRPVQACSGSSTSSESHSLDLRLNENPLGQEIGNGSGLHNTIEEAEEDDNHDLDDDFELISLLMACVEAIGSKNIAGINHFVANLGGLASPRGSPIARLTAYFVEALALRVSKIWPQIFHISVPRELDRVDDDGGTALRLLNQVSPIPKFIHFTSNEVLLRAFEGKERVHIIDFDVKQGLQWPSLFQSLASRANPPTHVRITGVGESKQDLIDTGDRLAGFAEALNLPFEFHPVVDRLEDVRLWMLHVKEGETVAVNCVFQLHKLLYDGSGGAIKDFLGLIRSTNPGVVLMGEQEAEHNDLILEARVSNSLKYYSAIFDSVDSVLPKESPVRIKIEEMFGREIRNVIACEGSDRIERHVKFAKWRKLMEQGGFKCTGIGERELIQSRMLLKMFNCENFSVEKLGRDEDALTLSWLDQPLYTVSAWAPVDVGGCSSSYSQPS